MNALDRAIILAIRDIIGQATNAFFLRVRDALIARGYSPEEANAIINSYLDMSKGAVDLTHITGDQRLAVNGFTVVRSSIIDVLDDILDPGMKHEVVKRVARFVKESFPGNITEVANAINSIIHGSPIESVEPTDDKLIVKLKHEGDFIACTLAHVRDDDPKLIEKDDGLYVFSRRS